MSKEEMTDMYDMVMDFPKLLTMLQISQEIQDTCVRLGDEGLGGIVIMGMGGSAIGGGYVQALLRDSARIAIQVNQDYTLPAYIDESWTAIAVSYSGNTEETLVAYDEAQKRGCALFAIASGGKLLEKERSLYKIRITPGYQPRAAFPLIFSVLLNLVECFMGLEPTDLREVARSLSKRVVQWENSSLAPKSLALDIAECKPIFIGAGHLIPVAYRAKCQMNENAKMMAFYSQIPEANHNELESFIAKNDTSILPVFLRSSFEDNRTKMRMDLTSTYYEEEGYSPIRLSIKSSSRIEEMLVMTLYLDLVSAELAKIREVDPTSVEQISKLKMELG